MAPTNAPMSVEKPLAKASGVNGDSKVVKPTEDALTGIETAT